MSKKTLELEINEFLEVWGSEQLISFVKDLIPLFELYHVDEDDDWLRDQVGQFDKRNVRLIRTVYLMSQIAERHSAKLCHINARFKNIWKRLEDINAR